jgi:SAM-dependent methyltransferase
MTSAAWRRWRAQTDLDEYDARWDRMAAAGEAVHGEADFVAALNPTSVLDAGCGTGRVGIELARRGIDVVGVDADPEMLDRARRRAFDGSRARPRVSEPIGSVAWIVADLAALDLGRTFDVVVLAGNVLPFVEPADRPAAVSACARHLAPDGRLVAGAGLQRGWPSVDELDAWSAAAGLELVDRFAGWAGERWTPASGYAVTVSRRR